MHTSKPALQCLYKPSESGSPCPCNLASTPKLSSGTHLAPVAPRNVTARSPVKAADIGTLRAQQCGFKSSSQPRAWKLRQPGHACPMRVHSTQVPGTAGLSRQELVLAGSLHPRSFVCFLVFFFLLLSQLVDEKVCSRQAPVVMQHKSAFLSPGHTPPAQGLPPRPPWLTSTAGYSLTPVRNQI